MVTVGVVETVVLVVIVMVLVVVVVVLTVPVFVVTVGVVETVVLVVIVMMLVVIVLIMVVVMVMRMLGGLLLMGGNQLLHHIVQRGVGLHRLTELLAGQLVPRRGDQRGAGVVLTDQLHSGLQLGLGDVLGPAQDDTACCLDLVVIELTEVLHIELDLGGVRHGNRCAENGFMLCGLLHRHHHVRELADAGGLDQDAVGVVVVDHLLQRSAEVAHQRTADAAGIHLGDLNAGLLEKATVNANLTEFVFDQNQLLPLIGLGDHLFDQRGFSCAEETGVNVNCRHRNPFFSL